MSQWNDPNSGNLPEPNRQIWMEFKGNVYYITVWPHALQMWQNQLMLGDPIYENETDVLAWRWTYAPDPPEVPKHRRSYVD
jgi:hypothetical protein